MNKACLAIRVIPILISGWFGLLAGGSFAQESSSQNKDGAEASKSEIKRAERKQFQTQELTTAKRNGWIFNPGDTPRIVWRDVESVRQLGFHRPLCVRWFGGFRHPHLENVILNGIDVNEPNVRYAYSGAGYDLAAKAMEIVAGKSAVRLYDEHLFRPLGFGDVPIGNASADAHLTARELAILGQWICNRGSYGDLEFISPETFAKLLPERVNVAQKGAGRLAAFLASPNDAKTDGVFVVIRIFRRMVDKRTSLLCLV